MNWGKLSIVCLLISLSCLPFSAAAAEPNDPFYGRQGSWGQSFDDQWGVKAARVHAPIANRGAAEDNSTPVIVAVIDTGIDYEHEDLAGQSLWHNQNEQANGRDDDGNGYVDDLIGWNFVNHSNNPWDYSGHGTHIAGVIAACTNNQLGIAGVNPHARVMSLKVANFIGQARSSAVAAAIRYAADNGARIINLSLGSELVTELERQAAAYATERGVLIIVSAGNRGLPAIRQGYATLPDVLVVGATDTNGERAGFSNFGAQLAVVAPGVDVLSLRARETDFIELSEPLDYTEAAAVVGESGAYYRASGTSFAAALASGIASKVLSARPTLSRQQLYQVLVQSAQDIPPAGVDQLTGYGQLDYVRAMGADPDLYTQARLTNAQLELSDGQLWVSLIGSAAAANFQKAELDIRAAEGSVPVAEPADKKSKKKKKRKKGEPEPVSPYTWQSLQVLSEPVVDGTLSRVALDGLSKLTQGATEWEIRLTVTNADGTARQAWLSMAMPSPEAALGGP